MNHFCFIVCDICLYSGPFIRYITNTILVLVQESKTTICYTMRIDAGMICSILILCCIAAWQVLWLLPQFFFFFWFGLMEGLANEGLSFGFTV